MNWKRTAWILWAANFSVMAGMSLVVPFLPLYIEQLGIHQLPDIERWSGWVFSAQFITAFLFQPIWGAFADRHGRKLMLLRAGFGMGIVTASMGLVGAPWQLLLLRMLNGVFGGFIAMSVSLLASVTPEEHSGRALGLLQTGTVAGSLVGPLAGGLLAETIGIRAVFYVTGALLLVASVIVMLFVHEPRQPARQRAGGRTGVRELLPLIVVFAASMTTQVGMMSIEPIVTLYAKTMYHGRHLTLIAGLVFATSGIANIIGSPLLGRLGDRIGQRRILVVSLLMAAVAFVPQALATSIAILLAGRFALGLFVGGMIPSLNVLVKKLAPPQGLATAYGINSSALFLGNLIGPLIGSSVAASYGIRSVFFVTMSVLLLNALLVAFSRRLQTPVSSSV